MPAFFGRRAVGVAVLVTVGVGVSIGLVVSLAIGLLNPGYEPSLEIEARGNPDLLDLGIAFASGMAAAYAQGRPNVASTLAGVAITLGAGIGVLMESDTEIGPSFVEEVQTLVRQARGETIPVEVHVLRCAQAR